MELREFISAALLDIIQGVTDAQVKTDKGTIVPVVRQNYKSIETGISELTAVEFEVIVKTDESLGSNISKHDGPGVNALRRPNNIALRVPQRFLDIGLPLLAAVLKFYFFSALARRLMSGPCARSYVWMG